MQQSKPIRPHFLPFSRPTLEWEEIDEVVDSMRSGWITMGPKVAKLEQVFWEWSGGQEAIAVNSATAGLHLALLALNLNPGDEVITTPITWPSTVNNIEVCGATPVFADVDPDTLQINPAEVEKRITSKTKAVIPVHFAGAPCDLKPIRDICARHGISLVEDAAHAVGACYGDRLVGSDSEIAVFSFHSTGNMTTGDGGMILCRDTDRAARMRSLRFHGISKDAWKHHAKGETPQYEVCEPGYQYNMPDLAAAIGLRQFKRLDEFNARRTLLAENYHRLFLDIPPILPLGQVPYPHRHAWHLYVVRLDLDALTLDRDQFVQALREENIGVELHFPCVHLHKYYRERYGYKRGDLPDSEWNSDRLFSLPLYPLLTESDQTDVVEAIRKLLKRYAR